MTPERFQEHPRTIPGQFQNDSERPQTAPQLSTEHSQDNPRRTERPRYKDDPRTTLPRGARFRLPKEGANSKNKFSSGVQVLF